MVQTTYQSTDDYIAGKQNKNTPEPTPTQTNVLQVHPMVVVQNQPITLPIKLLTILLKLIKLTHSDYQMLHSTSLTM